MAAHRDWDDFAIDTVYCVQRGYKNLAEIPASCGFIPADLLLIVANSMEGISKPDKNNMNFSVTGVTFSGANPSKSQLLKDAAVQKNASAEKCAEHTVWKHIRAGHQNGMHLAVRQDTGPCEQCMDKYRGLAMTKSCNIVLDYDRSYGELPNNGRLFFSDTGTVLLVAGATTPWAPR